MAFPRPKSERSCFPCAVLCAVLVALTLTGTSESFAQRQPPQGMVQLTFQGDVKLDVLVNYIADRLRLKFQYPDNISNRTVTIRGPGLVPIDTLPVLLGSVLKSENLMVVKGEQNGWYRIVDAGEMKVLAPIGEADDVLAEAGPAAPVTQIFATPSILYQDF